jgi:predicted acetyltransferase
LRTPTTCRTSTPTTTCPTRSWKSSGDVLSDIQLRLLQSGDNIEAELDLRRRAFGPVTEARLAAWYAGVQHSIDQEALLGAFDDGRLVGSARYHLMRQWWHGRSMPMAGVAGVKVAPEQRGRGVGTAMMARLLTEIADRGYPVSVLYPATAPLYRSFGWEIAGGKYESVLPARSLAGLINPDEAVRVNKRPAGPVHRATPGDGAAIVEVKGLVHARMRYCGPNTRDPWELRDWLDHPEHFAYLADDGFLSYRWARENDELVVEELIAASAATARALWHILGSHATIAGTVRACLAPDDAVYRLTREPDAELRKTGGWMLRIVDATAAISARGFPAGVSVSVPFDLADRVCPANTGRWRLEVADGRGSLQRADNDTAANPIRLGARGFAALFAGAGAGSLRVAGLASGGDRTADDALEAAFCGQAFMLDEW